MLIPSQREMVFLQSKSFFLFIDPAVQLELPEEQHRTKSRKKGKKMMGPWAAPESTNFLFKNKPRINTNLTPNSEIRS